MTRNNLREALKNRNVLAFLVMIRLGEGTTDPAGYRRMFGGKHFDSFADHPRVKNTATLGGKPISSTAAGAYQFLAGTWDGLVKQYGFDNFESDTQDEGAVALIAGRGALEDVIAGRFEKAVAKCAKEWASLPGSPYGQPTISMEKAKARYAEEGGTFEKEPPMAPFIAAAIPALIDAAPDLIRMFGKDGSKVAERNAQAAEKVVEIAKAVTNQPTAEGAVTAIQQDPELAAQFREQAYKQRLELSELAEKSVASAREFWKDEPPIFAGGGFQLKFWQLLALVFGIPAEAALVHLAINGQGQVQAMASQTLAITIIGGIMYFVYGSSYGSQRKDEAKRDGAQT